MRRTARLTALAAGLALVAAAPAAADARPGDLPAGAKVLGAPKLLSVKQAAKLRDRRAAGKRTPRAPRLKVKAAKLARVQAPAALAGPAPAPGARMFGNEAAYSVKRDRVLGAIQSFNATFVPQLGGTYRPPALYEVAHGSKLCGYTVINGAQCPTANGSAIAWSMTWTANAFQTSGDTMWAALIAHEYGHATQNYLGIRGGWFQYQLYGESFGDCMAGAFLWYASYNGMLDTVGRGDHYEFRDAFAALQSSSTTLNSWGTFEWRYAMAVYGWNNGFEGCTKWGRSIDGA